MKLYLYLLFAFLLFSSCYPHSQICSPVKERKAKRLMARAMDKCDYAVAKWVSNTFPVREFIRDSIIYKQGETKLLDADTIFINCDSIVRATPVVFNRAIVKTQKVRVPCPPVTMRIDTFYRDKEVTKESTAKLDVCIQEQNFLSDKLITAQQKSTLQSKKISWLLWLAGIGWGLFIIPFLFRVITKLWVR